jgi:hypothetical protein
VRRERDVERTVHEDGTPDFSVRLVAVAIGDLAGERDGSSRDGHPDLELEERGLEREAPHVRRHGGPVVERAYREGGSAQEVRL